MSPAIPAIPSQRPSLASRVFAAGSWTLLGNIAGQILRFGSNLWLTRLLFPEAFGLMAIAQSILAAVNLLSDVGLSQSVVRSHRGDEARFLDTIWTLQVAKGAGMLLVMLVASPMVARAYHQTALVALVPAMGVAAMVSGFASTKVALVNRQIQAARLTLMELGCQCVGIVTMLAWALVRPTPWALVAGNLANALAMTLASHLLLAGHGNRFAWDRGVVQEVWHFGGWVMVSSAVTFLSGEGRNLLNAALVTPKVVGLLVLSTTLALVVWNAIQQVSGRVLFPAYAEVCRERPHDLPAVVERSRRLQLLGGCAVAMLFAFLGDQLVAWFYDPRYRAAGAFLQIQATGTFFSFLGASYTGVLWAMGRPALSTFLLTIQVAVIATLTITGATLAGPIGLVTGASMTGLVMYPINSLLYRRLGLFQPKTDAIPIVLGVLLAAYVFAFGSWRALVI